MISTDTTKLRERLAEKERQLIGQKPGIVKDNLEKEIKYYRQMIELKESEVKK